ncbi:MAG: hypothetical protein ACYC8T_00440, partial [Myxococcaceae bacterium]
LLATCLGLHLVAFLSPLGWWVNLIGLIPLLYFVAARAAHPVNRVERALALSAFAVALVPAVVNHHLLGAERVAPFLPWHYYGLAGLWVGCVGAALAVAWPSTYGPAAAAADVSR